MRTELEQERRMAADAQFGEAAGEITRRLEDMRRRRKREALRDGMERLCGEKAQTAGQ